jgi:hypothetical protein
MLRTAITLAEDYSHRIVAGSGPSIKLVVCSFRAGALLVSIAITCAGFFPPGMYQSSLVMLVVESLLSGTRAMIRQAHVTIV